MYIIFILILSCLKGKEIKDNKDLKLELVQCIKNNDIEKLRVKIKQSSFDINSSIDDNNNTLLHIAAKKRFKGKNSIVAFLLHKSAKNLPNKKGITPFHILNWQKAEEKIVKLLSIKDLADILKIEDMKDILDEKYLKKIQAIDEDSNEEKINEHLEDIRIMKLSFIFQKDPKLLICINNNLDWKKLGYNLILGGVTQINTKCNLLDLAIALHQEKLSKFLIKLGAKPKIPFNNSITECKKALSSANKSKYESNILFLNISFKGFIERIKLEHSFKIFGLLDRDITYKNFIIRLINFIVEGDFYKFETNQFRSGKGTNIDVIKMLSLLEESINENDYFVNFNNKFNIKISRDIIKLKLQSLGKNLKDEKIHLDYLADIISKNKENKKEILFNKSQHYNLEIKNLLHKLTSPNLIEDMKEDNNISNLLNMLFIKRRDLDYGSFISKEYKIKRRVNIYNSFEHEYDNLFFEIDNWLAKEAHTKPKNKFLTKSIITLIMIVLFQELSELDNKALDDLIIYSILNNNNAKLKDDMLRVATFYKFKERNYIELLFDSLEKPEITNLNDYIKSLYSKIEEISNIQHEYNINIERERRNTKFNERIEIVKQFIFGAVILAIVMANL